VGPDPAPNNIQNSYFAIPFSLSDNYVQRSNISHQLEEYLTMDEGHIDYSDTESYCMAFREQARPRLPSKLHRSFQQQYLGVFWLAGAEIGTIAKGFQSIAKALGVYDAHDPEAVSKHFGLAGFHTQWLLIIDNLNGAPQSDLLENLYLQPTLLAGT